MASKDNSDMDDKLADIYHKKFIGEDYAEDYYKDVDGDYRFFMTNYFNYFSKAGYDRKTRHSRLPVKYRMMVALARCMPTFTATPTTSSSVLNSIIHILPHISLHMQRSKENKLKKMDSGHQLLDFGCGPVPIYVGTAAAASFPTTITMCDLVENNRNSITKFMQTTDGALMWEPHFKYMEKTLSDKRSSDIVKGLRAAFKEVVSGDVQNAMPIPGKKNYFDVIITNLTLEYSCTDVKQIKEGIKNLRNMLKPGGILMEGGALQINFYGVKEEYFPAVYLTTDIIKEMFKDPDMDMQLLVLNTLKADDRAGKATDHNGVFFLAAQKLGKDVVKKDLIEGHL